MEKKMTFEQAMARLEEIVALLDAGKCTLDDSLKLFEEGTHLTSLCAQQLKTAQQKIVKLTDATGEEFSDRQGEDMGAQLS